MEYITKEGEQNMHITKEITSACLFFTSINHLFVLLNQIIEVLKTKDDIVFISEYDSEKLYLRWVNLTEKINLTEINKIIFLDKSIAANKNIKKNDIIICIEECIANISSSNIKIDCYDLFTNKDKINEIICKYDYIINSAGICKKEELIGLRE